MNIIKLIKIWSTLIKDLERHYLKCTSASDRSSSPCAQCALTLSEKTIVFAIGKERSASFQTPQTHPHQPLIAYLGL